MDQKVKDTIDMFNADVIGKSSFHRRSRKSGFGDSDTLNTREKIKLEQAKGLMLFVEGEQKKQVVTNVEESPIWSMHHNQEIEHTSLNALPLNGFDEMISLTESGRLWRFPIDNEQGRPNSLLLSTGFCCIKN